MSTLFNNFFPKALFISLTIHTCFVCSSLLWQHDLKKRDRAKGVEISYKKQRKRIDMHERPVKPVQQLDLKNSSMDASRGSIPIKLAKEHRALPDGFMAEGRKREQLRSSVLQHRISVSRLTSAKINNPAYVAFDEMVRSRIEERVYVNYRSMRKMEAGSVYLTFVLASNGTLKASQVIAEKTQASPKLQNLSLKSLEEARFPPFLNGMTLPEYTFNIEVQYQIKE